MRKDVVRGGVAIVLLGAIIFAFGAFMGYGAYSTLIKAVEDPWDGTSMQIKAYEEMRLAELASSMGFFLALLGIAIAFYGSMLEPAPTVVATVAQPQQPPPQYPPQP